MPAKEHRLARKGSQSDGAFLASGRLGVPISKRVAPEEMDELNSKLCGITIRTSDLFDRSVFPTRRYSLCDLTGEHDDGEAGKTERLDFRPSMMTPLYIRAPDAKGYPLGTAFAILSVWDAILLPRQAYQPVLHCTDQTLYLHCLRADREWKQNRDINMCNTLKRELLWFRSTPWHLYLFPFGTWLADSVGSSNRGGNNCRKPCSLLEGVMQQDNIIYNPFSVTERDIATLCMSETYLERFKRLLVLFNWCLDRQVNIFKHVHINPTTYREDAYSEEDRLMTCWKYVWFVGSVQLHIRVLNKLGKDKDLSLLRSSFALSGKELHNSFRSIIGRFNSARMQGWENALEQWTLSEIVCEDPGKEPLRELYPCFTRIE